MTATWNRGKTRRLLLCTLTAAVLAGGIGVFAYANSASYSGQGLIADGFGGYDLATEICGVANGAEVNGPYLLWILTATGAGNANITGPWGTAPMTKTANGTFKYTSAWYSPATLPGNVSATYDGKAKNAQLTISHGCRPFTHGAWCSPGFWRNARPGAYTLIGVDPAAAKFNGTVIPGFYDTPFAIDPSLSDVLSTPNIYSGAPSGPIGLNAFNGTGAYLTSLIPGFSFDINLLAQDDSQTCPIDSFGNFK
jgi:hypothetical protein